MQPPDHAALFDIASGRFIRARRGVCRLCDYPSSPLDEVAAAWLSVGRDTSVVSHDNALDLLELSDVTPNAIHLTVPRSKRYTKLPLGVVVHTTTHSLERKNVTVQHGIRLTSPTRTVLDAAEAGTGPEQIEMAIRHTIDRGLVDPQRLEDEAEGYSGRARQLVHRTLERLPS